MTNTTLSNSQPMPKATNKKWPKLEDLPDNHGMSYQAIFEGLAMNRGHAYTMLIDEMAPVLYMCVRRLTGQDHNRPGQMSVLNGSDLDQIKAGFRNSRRHSQDMDMLIAATHEFIQMDKPLEWEVSDDSMEISSEEDDEGHEEKKVKT